MQTLTPAQKKHLYDEGYVVIPNVVPREQIRTALRKVNAWVGRGMPPEQMDQFASRSFCPELMHDPALQARPRVEQRKQAFVKIFALAALVTTFAPLAQADVHWIQSVQCTAGKPNVRLQPGQILSNVDLRDFVELRKATLVKSGDSAVLAIPNAKNLCGTSEDGAWMSIGLFPIVDQVNDRSRDRRLSGRPETRAPPNAYFFAQ